MKIMSIDAQNVRKHLAAIPRVNQFKERMQRISAITDKWGLLRQIYMEKMPEIWETSESDPLGQIDPYFVDWALEFTPIEKQAWHSIRTQGVPMYPQFPLFNHFVDFANPSTILVSNWTAKNGTMRKMIGSGTKNWLSSVGAYSGCRAGKPWPLLKII